MSALDVFAAVAGIPAPDLSQPAAAEIAEQVTDGIELFRTDADGHLVVVAGSGG